MDVVVVDCWGAAGSDEVSELSVGEVGVTVSVHAADNLQKFALGGVVATAAEEGAEVEGGDAAVIVLID